MNTIRNLCIVFLCFIGLLCYGQESTVEAKGTGVSRNDALQDALRNAVSQAVGVAISSNTTVENFMVISDAIASNTKGYIKTYSVSGERNTSEGYEVIVKAVVTTQSVKADFALLSKGVGGVRFMALYDDRAVPEQDRAFYDMAVDQMNAYFSSKKYRYIERTRFLSLQKEAALLMEDRDTSGVSYAQQLAFLADAQFIVLIKSISKESISQNFDTRTADKIMIQVVTYDNCTAEGLGSTSLEGKLIEAGAANTMAKGIQSAINNQMDDVVGTFSSYIGGWINNGIPYELRFYSLGSFRDLRELRGKLKSDVLFGGEMEVVSAADYSKINCTYKKKPDEMADKILDFSDQIPSLAAKKVDVKLIYGRQISFAPQGVDIKRKKVKDILPPTPEKKPVPAVNPPKEEKKTQVESTPYDPNVSGFTYFTEAGEKIWVVVNGQKINANPTTKVSTNNEVDANVKTRIIFQDANIPPMDHNVFLVNYERSERYNCTFAIKKNSKGKYVVRMISAQPIVKKVPGFQPMPVPEPEETPDETKTPVKQETKSTTNSTASQNARNCSKPLDNEGFQVVVAQISNAGFSETKMTIAQQISMAECFSIAQIKTLASQFSFEEDKLKWLKMAYDACTEKQKYYALSEVFTFSSSKENFSQFLMGKK